eukprot:scaffold3492_cov89-Skeletonema_marinoi.AAC.2
MPNNVVGYRDVGQAPGRVGGKKESLCRYINTASKDLAKQSHKLWKQLATIQLGVRFPSQTKLHKEPLSAEHRTRAPIRVE